MIGLEKVTKRFLKVSLSAKGATAPLIVSIPNMRMAKPIRISPMSCFFSLSLLDRMRMIPMPASSGENEDGLSSLKNRVLPSMPVSYSSHEVMVVPMFAPMMTPTAWPSFMMPELTNPTTMTVVADEL